MVESCSISGNAQNGLLVMDNASVRVRASAIVGNGAYGVSVRDGEVQQEDTVLAGNRAGTFSSVYS